MITYYSIFFHILNCLNTTYIFPHVCTYTTVYEWGKSTFTKDWELSLIHYIATNSGSQVTICDTTVVSC